jgi:hypothetical protein
MALRKGGTLFAEATGKTVKSIRYEENADWQALEVIFSDGTLFSFEFSSRVTVQARYFRATGGNLKPIRSYGRVTGNSNQNRGEFA